MYTERTWEQCHPGTDEDPQLVEGVVTGQVGKIRVSKQVITVMDYNSLAKIGFCSFILIQANK